jgi:hypothetical protein
MVEALKEDGLTVNQTGNIWGGGGGGGGGGNCGFLLLIWRASLCVIGEKTTVPVR